MAASASGSSAPFEPGIYCADTAIASLDLAHELLSHREWGDPVSHTSSRTLWSTELPRMGSDIADGDQRPIRSVRSEGRVRGVSPEIVRRLLQDVEFHRFLSAEYRWLEEVIVPQELWVVRQSVALEVPHIARREFASVCLHNELAGGSKLLIEQSVGLDDWPTPEAGVVRAYKYLAVAMHPVLRSQQQLGVGSVSSSSGGSNATASSDDAGDEASISFNSHHSADKDRHSVVNIVTVMQCDLGGVPAKFTENYALEAVELTHAINNFLAQSTWPATHKRLSAEGPRLPPRRQPRSPKVPREGSSPQSPADGLADRKSVV